VTVTGREVQLNINGRRHWLWRAVDQDGMVLDILVQARRNRKAAGASCAGCWRGVGAPPG
jgi:putative transposase